MKYICQILGLALSPPPSQHLQPHPHQLSYTLSTSQHNNNLLTTTIAMQQQQQHADRSSSPVRSRQRHQESGIFIFRKSTICNKSNIKMNNKFEANYKWRQTIQMTNDRPVCILPLVNYNVSLVIFLGTISCFNKNV